ncbi:hypothetical protein GCM10027418_18960 [Mariniluteicoccus endophyticus]
MNVIRAEILKLRRASSWVVVVVIPLLTVVTGTTNTVLNLGQLSRGWESLWGQITLFYGLIFLAAGIAVLSSSAWRMEHRGNWHRLAAGPVASWQMFGAKVVSVWLLVAAMQAVLLAATWASGVLVVGLPAVPPAEVTGGAAVTALAAVGVVALHCLLSMVIRSHAAPVALALLGCVGSVGLMLAGQVTLWRLQPYGALQRAASIGGSALEGSPALSWSGVAELVVPAAVLAVAAGAVAVAYLEKRDVRA